MNHTIANGPRSSIVGGAGARVGTGASVGASSASPIVAAVACTAVAPWSKVIAGGSCWSTVVGSFTNPRAIVDC